MRNLPKLGVARLLQLRNSATPQLRNSATPQLRNSATPQLRRLLIAFLMLCYGLTNAQNDFVDPDTLPIPMVSLSAYQSPTPVVIQVAAVVRFDQNSSLYVKWLPVVGAVSYTIQIHGGENLIYENLATGAETTFKIIDNLPLNSDLTLTVVPNGSADEQVTSGIRSVSTYRQQEPIEVSTVFYNELADWFSTPDTEKGLCEYLETANVHDYEKLSFLQAYSFSGKPFVHATDGSDLSDWYPSDFTPTDPKSCVPIDPGKCRCMVITDGNIIASPGAQAGGVVFPNIFRDNLTTGNGDHTSFNRNNAGPAKFWSARQDEYHGGSNFAYSSTTTNSNGLGGAAIGQATLRYFLGCITSGGDFNPNLPEDCQCERPLHLYYSYATNLYISPQKRTCPWSKGAGAQAEDMAFVTVLEGKTGMPSIITSGAKSIARSCNSNWNPTFFTSYVNVAAAVGSWVATSGLGGSGSVTPPTAAQITAFATALNAIIGTPAFNKTGTCGTTEESSALLEGSSTYYLKPNKPIAATMHSAGYINVFGHGCYTSGAAIASDYYLLGVVESQLVPLDEECCVDKFAQYIAGSQSGPPVADLQLKASLTVGERIAQVGGLMAQFGTWDGLPTDPFSGNITLTSEYAQYDGVSCEGYNQFANDDRYKDASHAVITKVFPTIVESYVQVEFDSNSGIEASFTIIDILGNAVFNLPTAYFDQGIHTVSIPAYNLPAGNYHLKCSLGSNTEIYKFQTL
jgi:hypothetical protein